MEWAPPPRVKSVKRGGRHGRFSWTPLAEELLSMLFGKPPAWVSAPQSTHGGYKPHWGLWPAKGQPFLHASAVSPSVLHRTPVSSFIGFTLKFCGPGSSVGVATNYGLDGTGSNPGGGRDFPPVQTGLGVYPTSCKMGTGSFPRVKCGRNVLLTTHRLLVPRSWKSIAIPLPTLWATPGL